MVIFSKRVKVEYQCKSNGEYNFDQIFGKFKEILPVNVESWNFNGIKIRLATIRK